MWIAKNILRAAGELPEVSVVLCSVVVGFDVSVRILIEPLSHIRLHVICTKLVVGRSFSPHESPVEPVSSLLHAVVGPHEAQSAPNHGPERDEEAGLVRGRSCQEPVPWLSGIEVIWRWRRW